MIEENTQKKRVQEANEKAEKRKVIETEEEIRNLNNQISQLQATISKNKDELKNQEQYRLFIRELTDKEFIDESDRKKKEAHARFKKEWIAGIQSDYSMDDIIFSFEDIFPDYSLTGDGSHKPKAIDILAAAGVNVNAKPTSLKQSSILKPKKQSQEKTEMPSDMERMQLRAKLTEQDWGLIFEELLARDLIDFDDDLVREENHFKSTNQIEELFQGQEDENLMCIQRL
jgi:predicted RNase H-like nuclease (RuvC/YqgF family)